MAIHLTNPVTDGKVRELARLKNLGLTEAIDFAVEKALADERGRVERRLLATKAIQEQIAAWPKTGFKADKAFFDSLNDE